MKSFISLLIFSCLFFSSAFCCDKYEILKNAIQQSEKAWKHEYELRRAEVEQAGYQDDPTFYHYLWYSKGSYNANSNLLDLINELEAKE